MLLNLVRSLFDKSDCEDSITGYCFRPLTGNGQNVDFFSEN